MGVSRICSAWEGVAKPVVGMVHLQPLPGSPRYGGSMSAVVERALADARALEAGGVNGLMVENFGDVPFHKGRVGAETVAAMAAVVTEVRRACRVPIGVNMLRNDGLSALAVAAAVPGAGPGVVPGVDAEAADGVAFIRVNVLTAATLTDQGVIEGIAAELLRERARLGAGRVKVLADVQVKHAAPLVDRPLEQEVDELITRGLADGIIVSGWGTGAPTDPAAVGRVKDAAGDVPVLVGSGTTDATVAALAEVADGFIVGTHFKRGGKVGAAIDPARVDALMAELL